LLAQEYAKFMAILVFPDFLGPFKTIVLGARRGSGSKRHGVAGFDGATVDESGLLFVGEEGRELIK
jgi:hypothetical protein